MLSWTHTWAFLLVFRCLWERRGWSGLTPTYCSLKICSGLEPVPSSKSSTYQPTGQWQPLLSCHVNFKWLLHVVASPFIKDLLFVFKVRKEMFYLTLHSTHLCATFLINSKISFVCLLWSSGWNEKKFNGFTRWDRWVDALPLGYIPLIF